jgi:recombination protein RecR
LEKLIECFGKMPGVGPKTAERLAFYVLNAPTDEANSLAGAILEVKHKTSHCRICNNLCEDDECTICRNGQRDKTIICVVEQPKDLLAIEKTGKYNGAYHVLMGALSPLDGIGPGDLKIKELQQRIAESKPREIIIATNCNSEGETTATYLFNLLKFSNINLTRIACGIAVGSSIEYADQATLAKAIEGRRQP